MPAASSSTSIDPFELVPRPCARHLQAPRVSASDSRAAREIEGRRSRRSAANRDRHEPSGEGLGQAPRLRRAWLRARRLLGGCARLDLAEIDPTRARSSSPCSAGESVEPTVVGSAYSTASSGRSKISKSRPSWLDQTPRCSSSRSRASRSCCRRTARRAGHRPGLPTSAVQPTRFANQQRPDGALARKGSSRRRARRALTRSRPTSRVDNSALRRLRLLARRAGWLHRSLRIDPGLLGNSDPVRRCTTLTSTALVKTLEERRLAPRPAAPDKRPCLRKKPSR